MSRLSAEALFRLMLACLVLLFVVLALGCVMQLWGLCSTAIFFLFAWMRFGVELNYREQEAAAAAIERPVGVPPAA